jgi:hypothetical protein
MLAGLLVRSGVAAANVAQDTAKARGLHGSPSRQPAPAAGLRCATSREHRGQRPLAERSSVVQLLRASGESHRRGANQLTSIRGRATSSAARQWPPAQNPQRQSVWRIAGRVDLNTLDRVEIVRAELCLYRSDAIGGVSTGWTACGEPRDISSRRAHFGLSIE